MTITITSGVTLTGGIGFLSETSTTIGNTSSTASPTLAAGVNTGTSPNGSPFSTTVNSYYWTAGATVPPYYYASVPGSAGFAFGTGDFTVEWFQYETDTNSFPRIWWYGTSPSLGVSIESGTFYAWAPSFTALKTGLSQKNAWRHFALVRISGKAYLYYDGALQNAGGTTFTSNITDTSSTFYIGSKAGSGLASEQFGGSITSFRICKGLGVYTGNFTKPTSPLGQTQSANPYGGANTAAISSECVLLLNP